MAVQTRAHDAGNRQTGRKRSGRPHKQAGEPATKAKLEESRRLWQKTRHRFEIGFGDEQPAQTLAKQYVIVK